MLMKTLAQDFVVYLEAELGYSPLTATSYRYDLWQFFDFLQRQGMTLDPEKVTTTGPLHTATMRLDSPARV